jgi:CubicO group peptidase (beta-lactamase class C family)
MILLKNPVLHIRSTPAFLVFIITIFCFTAGLGSCNSIANKKNIAADAVSSIALAFPVPLSKAETQRLNYACAKWYDSSLKPAAFNGGILVAKNGNIVFEAYNGNAHADRHDAVDSLTPFHIASVSKTFTAMAVLKLWQNGKLNIDDELSKYFPAFNYPGITIRSLLNHRSGLPNYLYFMEMQGWDKTKLLHNEDVLDYLITRKAGLTNITAPNTHFTYCNTNYALLALLIEKQSGKKLADYLQQTFFVPLNMKHTFLFNSLDTSKINPSYDWRGRIIGLSFLDGVYGDKNIYTTPRDLLIWDRALTDGKLFTPQTLDQAYTPYSNEKAGIKNYGLGWRMNIYPNGKKTIYHNGWWHGSNAAFVRLLQDSATIIIIGNKYNRNIYHAKQLANIFGDYDRQGLEEDESENAKVNDLLLPLKHDSLVFKPTNLSKKDALLRDKLRDKNKEKKQR